MPRRIVAIAVALLVVLATYLLAWPVPIDPVAWEAPPDPGLAVCDGNDALADLERVAEDLVGPEAVAIDAQGRLLTGLVDGRVVRVPADGGAPEVVADTGGRPLGIKIAPDGRLVVADAIKGLLTIDAAGAVTVLSTAQGGVPYAFTDDLDLLRDGTIVFTDASARHGVDHWKMDVLEHRDTGRLLALRPRPDGSYPSEPELLLGGLHFANGVASPDGESVVVCEMAGYKLHRVWVTGDQRGKHEVLVDNLPGFCDNLTFSKERGVFWVALGNPRNKIVDALAAHPFLRKVVVRLPSALQPKPQPDAIALAVDERGQIVQCLRHRGADAYAPVASILERDGALWLGSFAHAGLARKKLP